MLGTRALAWHVREGRDFNSCRSCSHPERGLSRWRSAAFPPTPTRPTKLPPVLGVFHSPPCDEQPLPRISQRADSLHAIPRFRPDPPSPRKALTECLAPTNPSPYPKRERSPQPPTLSPYSAISSVSVLPSQDFARMGSYPSLLTPQKQSV